MFWDAADVGANICWPLFFGIYSFIVHGWCFFPPLIQIGEKKLNKSKKPCNMHGRLDSHAVTTFATWNHYCKIYVL